MFKHRSSLRLWNVCHDSLTLFAQRVNTEFNVIAGFQKYLWFLSQADAGGRTGRDDIAWLKAHIVAQVTHNERRTEDHGTRIPILVTMAIHLQPHAEVQGVINFVSGDKPRPYGAECVASFAFVPLGALLELKPAFRDIVADAIAGNMVFGLFFSDVYGVLANSTSQSNLSLLSG